MALMNMHANLLIKLIILLKIHLSSQGHFCNDFKMFQPLVMHGAIENHFGPLFPNGLVEKGKGKKLIAIKGNSKIIRRRLVE